MLRETLWPRRPSPLNFALPATASPGIAGLTASSAAIRAASLHERGVSGSAHRIGVEMMPTVLRAGSYRFFFYAGDRDEPAHVHIEREDKVAKFWLDPVRLHSSGGFSRNEINKLHRIVEQHKDDLLRAWNEYFGD